MFRSRFCLCVVCALLSFLLALAVLAFAPPEAAAQEAKGVSFINDVAPILKDNCFACHDAKKRKGKLDMTTFENFRKGGENEDPIVPGKPEESFVMLLLTSSGGKRMPPKESGEALPKEKIAVIEQWIKEGAKLDAGLEAKADLPRELRIRWKPPQAPAAYTRPALVNALAFTPDNQKLVVGGQHELTVWDVAGGKLEKRIHTRAERAYAMAFLPDGKLVVAGGRPGQEGDVRVYDIGAAGGRVENDVAYLDGVNDKSVMLQQLLDTDDSVLCLAVSPDGKRLVSGGCDRVVRVWDLSDGIDKAKLEQSIENHADWVFGLALAPDGKHLLTCSRDKTAKVWDLAAKESVLTFPGHQADVYGVTIKPDGKTGVSVGRDNQVRLWTTASDGKQVRAVPGHTDVIVKIVPNPKRPEFVTCSHDKSVRIWNQENGAALRTLSGHGDVVYTVAISSDGALIASAGFDGEVRVWKAADGSLVKAFNASPGFAPK